MEVVGWVWKSACANMGTTGQAKHICTSAFSHPTNNLHRSKLIILLCLTCSSHSCTHPMITSGKCSLPLPRSSGSLCYFDWSNKPCHATTSSTQAPDTCQLWVTYKLCHMWKNGSDFLNFKSCEMVKMLLPHTYTSNWSNSPLTFNLPS